MKRLLIGAAIVAAGVIGAKPASAATIAFNFCPGNASCAPDLTEASLTFVENLGSADVNDYTLTVRFVGTNANLFIDAIDFTSGIDFTSIPVLTSAPTGTVVGNWATIFDKVNASGNSCDTPIANQKVACSMDTVGNGPSTAGINDWVYSVNFAGTALVSATSGVNLRALFVDAQGNKVGAIMSPDGNFVTTTTTATPTTTSTPTTGNVPEPTALALFGAALVGAAYRLRRRA